MAAADQAKAEAVIGKYTGDARASVANGSTFVVIPNPDGLQSDEHPYLGDLVRELRTAGIPVRSLVG